MYVCIHNDYGIFGALFAILVSFALSATTAEQAARSSDHRLVRPFVVAFLGGGRFDMP